MAGEGNCENMPNKESQDSSMRKCLEIFLLKKRTKKGKMVLLMVRQQPHALVLTDNYVPGIMGGGGAVADAQENPSILSDSNSQPDKLFQYTPTTRAPVHGDILPHPSASPLPTPPSRPPSVTIHHTRPRQIKAPITHTHHTTSNQQ